MGATATKFQNWWDRMASKYKNDICKNPNQIILKRLGFTFLSIERHNSVSIGDIRGLF